VIPLHPDPLDFALALAGAAVGYLIFRRVWARPWSYNFQSASEGLARRIARSAPAVLRQSELSPDELAVVSAFYTRWINMSRKDREAHGEALRAEGIDMIRLGDSLRWYRDRP